MPVTQALALLLAAVGIATGLPASAEARTQMRSIFQDDCLLVQLDIDGHCAKASRAATLDAMKSLGADTIKATVLDDKVRHAGWGAYDATVRETVARGMAPLLTLTARGKAPSVGPYVSFVRSVVQRYPQVHLWSLYNEPNNRYFMSSASPRTYRALYVAGQAALRRVAGHGGDTVLIGELAPRKTGGSRSDGTPVGPLAFTRELFCLDSHLRPYRGAVARRHGCASFRRLTAQGFAFHPYTNARGIAPPSFVDPGDGASVATLGRITRILDAAARQGHANRMNIWDTEFGFQSRPTISYAPTPAQQAEYLNWSDWLQYRNPRVATVSQYDLDDTVSSVNGATGLRFYDERHKPAWDAYRLPIFVTGAGRGFVRVWGQVRPGNANTVAVQKQSRGRGPFRAVARVRTNPAGYFERRYRGGGRDRWRLSWRTFTSRTATAR